MISKLIEEAIEAEIELRVQERLTQVLEKISQTYDIRLDRLMKDIQTVQGSKSSTCCGLTKAKKRCTRPGKHDGYCKIHVSQKPDIRRISAPLQISTQVDHTHTFPPMFLKGCPACENSTNLRKQFLDL
jgi:hypothetical protein